MFARTERLLLRPSWIEDAPALAEAIGDEAIVRNLATAPWPYGLAEAKAFVTTKRQPRETSLLVFRRTHRAAQLIGSVGFERSADGEIELGYWISRPHWGLGYATEAAGAMVALARHSLRLKRLSASHFLDNPASGRVLEKIGFRASGIIEPRHSAGRGGTAPSKLYTLSLDAEPAEAEDVAAMACGDQMVAA
ncbi:MAG: N-acetyltransferase [Alphaproteobacteria bacterium]|nr:N-acetyltransferase [Alphaproteobacteria bacterium]